MPIFVFLMIFLAITWFRVKSNMPSALTESEKNKKYWVDLCLLFQKTFSKLKTNLRMQKIIIEEKRKRHRY